MITVAKPGNSSRRAGGDQNPRMQRQDAGEKTDMIPQSAYHITRMRTHYEFAVLLYLDGQVLRVVYFIFGHNPRAEACKGVKAFADVSGAVSALPPWYNCSPGNRPSPKHPREDRPDHPLPLPPDCHCNDISSLSCPPLKSDLLPEFLCHILSKSTAIISVNWL